MFSLDRHRNMQIHSPISFKPISCLTFNNSKVWKSFTLHLLKNTNPLNIPTLLSTVIATKPVNTEVSPSFPFAPYMGCEITLPSPQASGKWTPEPRVLLVRNPNRSNSLAPTIKINLTNSTYHNVLHIC